MVAHQFVEEKNGQIEVCVPIKSKRFPKFSWLNASVWKSLRIEYWFSFILSVALNIYAFPFRHRNGVFC